MKEPAGSDRRRSQPPATERLPFIDSLRGFALFGVFGANLMIFSGYTYMTEERQASLTTSVLGKAVHLFEAFFVENKFIGLFSVLFGISFWLFLDRVRARSRSATTLFYRRIGWLFLFGALHGWLLWCFDVLRFYALWAILLPLFARMPLRRLLVAALSAGIFIPAVISGLRGVWPRPADRAAVHDALALEAFSNGGYVEMLSANWTYDWYLTNDLGQAGYQTAVFGRLLVGLFLARALRVGDLGSHRTALRRAVLAGAAVGVVGNGMFVGQVLRGANGFFRPFLRRMTIESGFLGLTLAMAAGLAILFIDERGKGYVRMLAPLGQMALTFYLAQTLIGLWLFYGFMPGPHLMGKVGPASIAGIWLLGYGAQVGLAHLWMQRFRFGPAEWLWRSLTYWTLQPIRTPR
jgi:uncharacterized protein